MNIDKNRQAIACYWESQPNGCLRVNCPFFHSKPRPFGMTPAISLSSAVATNLDPATLLHNRVTAVPSLNSSIATQHEVTNHASVPTSQTHLQHVLNVPVTGQIPTTIAANLYPATDSSFQEHVRMFKEMIKGKTSGSPKRDLKKRRLKKDDSAGDSSDSEFDEILASQAKQKKEKSYQAFKKERRDRKVGKQYSLENRYKSKEDEERRSRQEKTRYDPEERRKYREMKARRKEEKERQRKQREKKKKEKKVKKEKEKDDLLGVVSSDDFELVEDSDEKEDAEVARKETVAEGEEDAASKGRINEEEEEGDTLENGEKNEDATKTNVSSSDEIGGKKDEMVEQSADKDLGFHIKSYEEILREKALRKMLERRQQLQPNKESVDTSSSVQRKPDENETGKQTDSKEEGIQGRATGAQINKDRKTEVQSTVKSEIRPPDDKGFAEKAPPIVDNEDKAAEGLATTVKSQVVKVSSNSSGSVTGATKTEREVNKNKKLRVVRKVGIKQTGSTEPVVDRKLKGRQSREIYKPPGKSTQSEELNESKQNSSLKLKRIAKLPEAGIERSDAKDAKTEPSPGPKVKSFEEIMEEKKAKRLGRFGGAPSKEDLSNRKLKVTQTVTQRSHDRPKNRESKNANEARVSKTNVKGSYEHESVPDGRSRGNHITYDKTRNDVDQYYKDNRKPKIIKRDIDRVGFKRRSSDEGDNDIPRKISRATSKDRIGVAPSQQKQTKSNRDKVEEDVSFDDLEDIDLDIGVEVEDTPKTTLEKEEVKSTLLGEDSESVDIDTDGVNDINDALNAELEKKKDLLSDDELERELELTDFSSLGSDEEIDDDALLLELEEMINS